MILVRALLVASLAAGLAGALPSHQEPEPPTKTIASEVASATIASESGSATIAPEFDSATIAPEFDSATIASARARWDRFTPEQRERAKVHYERFLALSEEERVQLVESARRLRRRAERVEKELPPHARARLTELEPSARRAVVREIAVEEAREVGAGIRARLPQGWLDRLEAAPPAERARTLVQFQIEQRNRVARYAIGELGRKLALAPQEIARLQSLPGEDRARALLDLQKQVSEREVDESGLPPGITREQWASWQSLPPEEFFEVFQRYRRSRAGAAAGSDGRRALLEAARPRHEDALAFADLPAEERAWRVAAAKRVRCVRAIRENRLMSGTELEALEAQSDRDFFLVVRRLVAPLRRAAPAAPVAPTPAPASTADEKPR